MKNKMSLREVRHLTRLVFIALYFSFPFLGIKFFSGVVYVSHWFIYFMNLGNEMHVYAKKFYNTNNHKSEN